MKKVRFLAILLAMVLVFSTLTIPAGAAASIIFKGISNTYYTVYPDTDILREGMNSNIKINLVQNMLKQEGKYPYTVDGDYGWRCTAQVMVFQNAHQLSSVDGVVGSETWYQFALLFVDPNQIEINGM